MAQQGGGSTDPAAVADYRRLLIIHGPKEVFSALLFDRILGRLKEFDPQPVTQFEMGERHVDVRYLANAQRSVGEAIAELQPAFPELTFERDVRLAALAIDDPLYRRQWALKKIEAKAAWKRLAEAGQHPVTVGIVDSGIKLDHEDFNQSNISGAGFVGSSGGNFADNIGHGTMLAGTIGAVTNNALGIAGEVPGVFIRALKFIDARNPPTLLGAVRGILDAVDNNVKIINASWHVLEDHALLRTAILFAGSRGCLVVAAAGNDGSNNAQIPTLPASYHFDNMIVAMASDEHDDKCWFSNYGDDVDVAAPGIRVLTTGLYFSKPAYREYSGTSVAAAHVSGAAALLLAIDDWTPTEIRDHLVASADPVPHLRGLCRANGRLNLRRAVCGPFAIVSPAGGEQLQRGSSFTVKWQSEYVAPVVNSVEISFLDRASGAVLGKTGGLTNNGQRSVVVPNQAAAQAFVRLRCEQKNLYADSAIFQIG